VELVDPARANPDRLKALGAAGVVSVGNGLQAIFGTRSENLKGDMEEYLRAGGAALPSVTPASVVAAPSAGPSALDPDALRVAASVVPALGGARNIVSTQACAMTRVRVKVVDLALVSEASLAQSAVAVMRLDGNVLHLIVGPKSEAIASAMMADLQVTSGRARAS
jgi:PTS system glucose-specific IIC component